MRLLSVVLISLLGPFALAGRGTVQAQGQGAAIERLAIDIWPDFDRPSALVLLTGSLPADTLFPATVLLPWPDGAELNAVAVMTNEGFFNFTNYVIEEETLNLTLQDPEFRVEYYQPYEQDGEQHRFHFEWMAQSTVNGLAVRVQRPGAATSIELSQPEVSVTQETYGLDYYNLEATTLTPGEVYSLTIEYTLPDGQLTEPLLDPAESVLDSPAFEVEAIQSPNEPNNRQTLGYALIAIGVVGLLAILGWAVWTRRQPAPARRPTRRSRPAGKRQITRQPRPATPPAEEPTSPPAQGEANFCHQCGTAVVPGDKFCRNCGARLKA